MGRRVTKRWRERERGHTGENAWAVGGRVSPFRVHIKLTMRSSRPNCRNASGMGQWDFSSIHAQAIHKPGTGQAGRGIWMEIGRREGRPPQLQAPGERWIQLRESDW